MQGEGDDPVYSQALRWVVVLREEDADAQDRAACRQWLDANPAHREAFERALELWDRFEVVKPEVERMRRRDRLTRRGIVAGGLAVLVGAPALYYAARPGRFADFRTDPAERRRFTLADGSSIELGSDTAISDRFGARQRRLVLHHGQAFFDVARDPERPFVVEAGGGEVEALGTQFDIRHLEAVVTVSVVENAVRVSAGGQKPHRVEAGWQASYGRNGLSPTVSFDPAVVAAWRHDRIVFDDVPLSRVLAELERYRRGRIFLVGDSVGNIPITAVFDTKDAAGALKTIEETLPVRVVDGAGYVALVMAR